MRISSKERALEFLQNYSFHMFELPKIFGSDITITDRIPVLSPVAGFNSITAPEISANVEEIIRGNRQSPYKYISGWTYGPITLTQGSAITRDDFAPWVKNVMDGRALRRSFLLVHFTRKVIGDFPDIYKFARLFTAPAKAWLLADCYPIRFKAGSDFDAMSGDVSIQELEIDPLEIRAYGLGLLRTLIGA